MKKCKPAWRSGVVASIPDKAAPRHVTVPRNDDSAFVLRRRAPRLAPQAKHTGLAFLDGQDGACKINNYPRAIVVQIFWY